ncbi:MAG: hypothetical protein QOI90_1822 [Mycobacterium sp.]|nr:hypothetical protein [Mycobacterium sp.]
MGRALKPPRAQATRNPPRHGNEWRECKAKSAGHVSPHRLRIYRLQIVPASGV